MVQVLLDFVDFVTRKRRSKPGSQIFNGHDPLDWLPNELITAVDLPPMADTKHAVYLKVRDRSLYAFALVSVAAALTIENGSITGARIALGGVAHKPWREPEAEALIQGSPDRPTFERAADRLLQGAHAYRYNQYKLALARKSVIRALSVAAAST